MRTGVLSKVLQFRDKNSATIISPSSCVLIRAVISSSEKVPDLSGETVGGFFFQNYKCMDDSTIPGDPILRPFVQKNEFD